jgi:hypothetical protein
MISSRICKIYILREEFVGANQDKDTMAEATTALRRKPISSFKKRFLEGHVKEVEGPHEKEGGHHGRPSVTLIFSSLTTTTSIIIVSFISRALRSTELRVEKVELNDAARQFIGEAMKGKIRIIANRPDRGDVDEYRLKEKEERWNNHIPASDPVLFFEVRPGDVSDFSGVLRVQREVRPCRMRSPRSCCTRATHRDKSRTSTSGGRKGIRSGTF